MFEKGFILIVLSESGLVNINACMWCSMAVNLDKYFVDLSYINKCYRPILVCPTTRVFHDKGCHPPGGLLVAIHLVDSCFYIKNTVYVSRNYQPFPAVSCAMENPCRILYLIGQLTIIICLTHTCTIP